MIALPSRIARILLIDQDAAACEEIEALLWTNTTELYEVTAVSHAAAEAEIKAGGHDVILLSAPAETALCAQLMRAARAAEAPVPVILLQDQAVPGRAEDPGGAIADVLERAGLDGATLRCSIRYALRQGAQRSDRTVRRQLEERVLSISDDEQRRIGADLHDNLGQHLTGIACLVTALRTQLEREGSALSERADHIAGCVTNAIEATRLLARGLCPAHVEQWGLRAALEDLAAQVQRLQGVACAFEPSGPALREDPETATHVYRIAQEAIANAVRHGNASKIAIRLDSTGELIRLVVEDDGVGFAPVASAGPGGLGLHLMEHRAAMIGGRFRISPQPRGVQVECLFPRSPTPHAVEA